MKGKRSKQYRKLMHAYQLTFNFREPYQVLITADIIQDAARFKMRLGSMLENTLHGEIKPMITQCCIRHLYNAPASSDKDAWIEVAKQAERRRCGHHELEQPLSAKECLESVVDPKGGGTNKHRYVVASQEKEVRVRMREIAGVPLIYIARSVMILEPMASKSSSVREGDEKAKIRAGLKSRRSGALSGIGEKRKREDDDEESEHGEQNGDGDRSEQPAKKRKGKGPKEPNPLSVKKSKKEATKESEQEKAVMRRAMKNDPQAAEKAGLTAVPGEGTSEPSNKRKRKRKPKEASDDGGD